MILTVSFATNRTICRSGTSVCERFFQRGMTSRLSGRNELGYAADPYAFQNADILRTRARTHIRSAGTVLARSEYNLPRAAWELTSSRASSCVAPRQTDELRSSFRDAQASRCSERRMNINEGCRPPGGCPQIDQTDRPRQTSMASKPLSTMHASRTPQCCQPASDPYDIRTDFQAHCDITFWSLASATVLSIFRRIRRPMLLLHFSTGRHCWTIPRF